MTNTVRNLAGFVSGWLFILALAFGMEAAHAEIQCPADFVPRITVNSAQDFSASWIQTSHPIKCSVGDIFGSYGSFLGACFRPVGTVIQVNNETTKIVAGPYGGPGCNPTSPTTNNCEQGGEIQSNDANNGVYNSTYRNAYQVTSECIPAQCVAGSHMVEGQCVPDTCQATPEGNPPDYVGGGTISGASGPLCYDGCIVTPVEDIQIGLCITIDSQAGKKGCKAESAVSLKRAGGACPADSTARRDFIGTLHSITDESGNTYSLDPQAPTNCVSGNGKTICLETDPDKDCGTVNGETVCVPQVQRNNKEATKPDKICTDLDGKAYCISRDKTAEPAKPPAPAEPAASKITKGEPGSKIGTGEANGTTINVYNSPSQSGSSSGGSGSGGSSGTSGSSGTGTETGTGSCGGSGQPSCAVRIDETGTPSTASAFSTESYSTATTGAATSIENKMAETDPLSGWGGLSSVMGIIPVLPYGECQSITFEVWGGRSVTFPGQRACVGLEKLKTYEAYFLYVVTIFSCVLVMLRARAGNKED